LAELVTREIAFDALPTVFDEFLRGVVIGRTLVRIGR
jgi:hypothetical protein